MRGGLEAERAERVRCKQEEMDRERRNFEAMQASSAGRHQLWLTTLVMRLAPLSYPCFSKLFLPRFHTGSFAKRISQPPSCGPAQLSACNPYREIGPLKMSLSPDLVQVLCLCRQSDVRGSAKGVQLWGCPQETQTPTLTPWMTLSGRSAVPAEASPCHEAVLTC